MASTRGPGVEQLLSLGDGSELLDEAHQRWDAWVEIDDRLGVVADLDALLRYVRTSTTEEANTCLLVLAMLAAPDGNNDIAAAAALAKALIPGACVLASRLTVQLSRRRWYPTGCPERGPVSRFVNERVAAQLWLEVRSFPWRRLTKVGGNILMSTRAKVLWECEDPGQLERFERTRARTSHVGTWHERGNELAPWAGARGAAVEAVDTPLEVLMDVLEWACANEVISHNDQSLLLCLVTAASNTEVRATTRGKGNLCSDKLSAIVAPQLGVSPATVRRHAARSVEALATAAPAQFNRD